MLAILSQFLSSTSYLVGSLDTLCYFFLNPISKNGHFKEKGAMRLPEINLLILIQLVTGET